MNKALLGKWFWKWFENKQVLWKQISFYKYYERKDWSEFIHSNRGQLSYFWKNLFLNVDSFLCSTRVEVGEGKHTLFWLDKWLDSYTLASLFPSLFIITSHPYASVSNLRKKRNNSWIWDIKFKRQLTGSLVFQFLNLLNLIKDTKFVQKEDSRIWLWETNGIFSVKSFYQFLIDGGLRFDCADIWKLSIPLKVKIMVWLALRQSLNTKDILTKKGIQLELNCVLCSKVEESHTHLFIECEFVFSLWKSIQFKLKIGKDFKMKSLKEVWLNWTAGGNKECKMKRDVLFCALLWCIWQERNDRLFSNKKKRALEILNKIMIFSTFWLGSTISDRAARLLARRKKKNERLGVIQPAGATGEETSIVIQLD
ncbi:uncharacterized protein LOC109828435 [Asparagus officinalis]|uniref:uncharacterized protein LOC109828435 n=1 Tax=Asparagus officinalis TaxID=4686 RepID=UPI00098DFFA1|nr:uncharacterized protein LOC109828435 [Asparagus officinalis]